MINSRSLAELTPRVEDKCRLFIDRCAEAGIKVVITSTYRDIEAQNELYAKGRTTEGKRVTNAAGGKSLHQYRVAFDFVPCDKISGRPIWDNDMLWNRCGTIGQQVGLEWGGTWGTFIDRPHFQDVRATIEQYLSGEVVEPYP